MGYLASTRRGVDDVKNSYGGCISADGGDFIQGAIFLSELQVFLIVLFGVPYFGDYPVARIFHVIGQIDRLKPFKGFSEAKFFSEERCEIVSFPLV